MNQPLDTSLKMIFLLRQTLVERCLDGLAVKMLADEDDLLHTVADLRIPVFLHVGVLL